MMELICALQVHELRRLRQSSAELNTSIASYAEFAEFRVSHAQNEDALRAVLYVRHFPKECVCTGRPCTVCVISKLTGTQQQCAHSVQKTPVVCDRRSK